MKPLACLLALVMLVPSMAWGEGWIVDDSLDDPFTMEEILASPKSATSPHVLLLSFVGDCSIGGKPDARGKADTYTVVVDQKGEEWPFSLVRSHLEADDFTFANNEVVFTESTRVKDKNTVLGALPRYARVYLHSGIEAVNTANNHCMDYLEHGYDDTLSALDALPIGHFGTLYPDTKQEKDRLGIFEAKGVRIGAVGFSYPQMGDLPAIQARIARLRQAGCALVVVSAHWGREEATTPKGWQITLAQRIIDAGADVIWGHHPHILQQVQFYKGKPIFYSTGNFTFGAMKSVDPDTGIFQLRYDLESDGPHLSNFTVIPCRTQGKGDYRPMVLTEQKEKRAMLKKLIYPHSVDGMQNLPDSFVETGTVDLQNGYLPGQ